MSQEDFDGTRVLILGGSGVLGSIIGQEMTRRGARVVLAGRDSKQLQAIAAEIGSPVGSITFDLNSSEQANNVVSKAAELLGGLDGIVNAAGVVAFGPFDSVNDDVLDELVAADFVGPLRAIRAALPHLEEGSFVVNITGVVAEQPMANMVAYSAVKAGLSAATRALGRELRRRKILVVDARPPHTETGLAQRPIAGTAPQLPEGLDPANVAKVIVDGIASGQRELPAETFQRP